jgi:hypothetical protein
LVCWLRHVVLSMSVVQSCQSLGHQLYVACFAGGYQYMWDTVDRHSPHNNCVENGCRMWGDVGVSTLTLYKKIKEERHEKWFHIQTHVVYIVLQWTENSRTYWEREVVELKVISFILMSAVLMVATISVLI